ncbi:hypothetical protein KFQ04_28905 (plasmid) [Pseudomonas synxantha]|nr:hypothetical protein KFQ04_28905 [Pseudomonas synxantha]
MYSKRLAAAFIKRGVMNWGSNSPLVGLKEFAEILGWDKARLSAKFSRQRDGKKVRPLLPNPIQILASTPVWTLKQAKKYKAIIDGRSAK